jgi:hypothetical protein
MAKVVHHDFFMVVMALVKLTLLKRMSILCIHPTNHAFHAFCDFRILHLQIWYVNTQFLNGSLHIGGFEFVEL